MAGNIKIPKRVGAVKLPKKLRRKAKKAIKAASSPLVRDFATATMAAAGRARRGGRNERPRESGPRYIGGEAHIDGNKVVEAIRTAAIDGFRRFLEGVEQGLRDVEAGAEAKDDPQPEPQPRPIASARPKAAAKPKPKPAAKPRARKAPREPASPRPRAPSE